MECNYLAGLCSAMTIIGWREGNTVRKRDSGSCVAVLASSLLGLSACDISFDFGPQDGAKVDCLCLTARCQIVTANMLSLGQTHCVKGVGFVPYTSSDVGRIVCNSCADQTHHKVLCIPDGTAVPPSPAQGPAPVPGGPVNPIPMPPEWIPSPVSLIASKQIRAQSVTSGVELQMADFESETECTAFCPTASDARSIPVPSYFPVSWRDQATVGAYIDLPLRGWDDAAYVTTAWTDQRARYFGGRLYDDCDAPDEASGKALIAGGSAASQGSNEVRPRAGINGFAGMGFVGRRSGV